MPGDDEQEIVLNKLRELKANVVEIEGLVKQDLCKDTLLKLSAVRTEIEQIGIYILESTANECLHQDRLKVKQTMDDMAMVMASLRRL